MANPTRLIEVLLDTPGTGTTPASNYSTLAKSIVSLVALSQTPEGSPFGRQMLKIGWNFDWELRGRPMRRKMVSGSPSVSGFKRVSPC